MPAPAVRVHIHHQVLQSNVDLQYHTIIVAHRGNILHAYLASWIWRPPTLKPHAGEGFLPRQRCTRPSLAPQSCRRAFRLLANLERCTGDVHLEALLGKGARVYYSVQPNSRRACMQLGRVVYLPVISQEVLCHPSSGHLKHPTSYLACTVPS